MARKKNVGPAAEVKHNRNTRRSRRDRKAHNKQQDTLNNAFAGLDVSSFNEEKNAGLAIRKKMVGKEPLEPAEIGEHVDSDDEPIELEESTANGLIQMQPDLINYKMVYMVDPNHRLLILRFPNRRPDQEFADVNRNRPLELRIKPKYGFVELDVPVTYVDDLDSFRAERIQTAMMQSAILHKGGSYGMAGGFGVNEEPATTKKGKGKAKETDRSEETVVPDHEQLGPWKFDRITLSGRIQRYDDTKPRMMAGVFKDILFLDVLYLSHVDAIVELTVSFQHVDALSDLEKTAARYQRDTREARESERERQLALQQAEAKAVHVAVKSSEPDEGMPEGRSRIKEMLQDFDDEPWQRMTWTDHDDPDSYRAFDDHFGLNKDVEELPDLVSTMGPREYLDSISCPRYDHTLHRYRNMTFPTTDRHGRFRKIKDFRVDEKGHITPYSDDEYLTETDSDEDEFEDEYDDEDDGQNEDGACLDGDEQEGSDEDGAESECESDTTWATVSEDAHL
ncbi:MAG: hypothetical protein Q9207_001670 [Kuettlingeria erythrocarpa]